jgi:hypothetical protein
MFLEIIERKNYKKNLAQKKPQGKPVTGPTHEGTPRWHALLTRTRGRSIGGPVRVSFSVARSTRYRSQRFADHQLDVIFAGSIMFLV